MEIGTLPRYLSKITLSLPEINYGFFVFLRVRAQVSIDSWRANLGANLFIILQIFYRCVPSGYLLVDRFHPLVFIFFVRIQRSKRLSVGRSLVLVVYATFNMLICIGFLGFDLIFDGKHSDLLPLPYKPGSIQVVSLFNRGHPGHVPFGMYDTLT